MIDENVLDALKKKFENIHPLIFQRSLQKSKTPGELFDILDTFPRKYPIIWDAEKRKWATTKDLVQVNKIDLEMEKK